jgi:hypothetical protein
VSAVGFVSFMATSWFAGWDRGDTRAGRPVRASGGVTAFRCGGVKRCSTKIDGGGERYPGDLH